MVEMEKTGPLDIGKDTNATQLEELKKTITVDVVTPTNDTPKVPVTTVVQLTNTTFEGMAGAFPRNVRNAAYKDFMA